MYDTLIRMGSACFAFLGTVWEWLGTPLIELSTLHSWFYGALPEVLQDLVAPFFELTPFEFLLQGFVVVLLLKFFALIWNALPIV